MGYVTGEQLAGFGKYKVDKIGSAITSASSLSTLGRIPSSPMDLWCCLDQSKANSGAAFPPLGQSIPGGLDVPARESKLGPACH